MSHAYAPYAANPMVHNKLIPNYVDRMRAENSAAARDARDQFFGPDMRLDMQRGSSSLDMQRGWVNRPSGDAESDALQQGSTAALGSDATATDDTLMGKLMALPLAAKIGIGVLLGGAVIGGGALIMRKMKKTKKSSSKKSHKSKKSRA